MSDFVSSKTEPNNLNINIHKQLDASNVHAFQWIMKMIRKLLKNFSIVDCSQSNIYTWQTPLIHSALFSHMSSTLFSHMHSTLSSHMHSTLFSHMHSSLFSQMHLTLICHMHFALFSLSFYSLLSNTLYYLLSCGIPCPRPSWTRPQSMPSKGGWTRSFRVSLFERHLRITSQSGPLTRLWQPHLDLLGLDPLSQWSCRALATWKLVWHGRSN